MVSLSVDLVGSRLPRTYLVESTLHIDLPMENRVLASCGLTTDLPLINVNCGNLWSSDDARGGFYVSSEALENAAAALGATIERDVMPVATGVSRPWLISNLASSNHREWITSDPVSRHRILIAAAALDGRMDARDRWLASYEEYARRQAPRLLPEVAALGDHSAQPK